MSLLDGLRHSPVFLALATGLLGLCVGSFLNVVAYRLPQMLERQWRRECRHVLELPDEPAVAPLSLLCPGSSCPACKTPIRPWHNIPVLSWLWLRGRCATCGAGISVQYPLVEALTGLLSVWCVWRFGWSIALPTALLFTWTLTALAVIDLRTQLLPDDLTLPLLWAGLLFSLAGTFTTPQASIVGAAAGYLSLWSVYHLFRLLTGKEGMGHGDFKLLAALGAWLGWQMLPLLVLLSSLLGTAVGLTLILFRGHSRHVPIPFGPYLAMAGWIMLIWGRDLTAAWLQTL
ncbi:MAG: A24 family peptidase [Nevskiales bacterium]|nr:A24 family peptidase [Nevskiales bacterium]